MIQFDDLIDEFVEKSKIHVENVQSLLSGNIDSNTINNCFIAVHSIKGTSGFFGFEKIMSLACAMESIFIEIRDNNMSLNDSLIKNLLSSNQRLNAMLENVHESENTDISDLVKDLTNALPK